MNMDPTDNSQIITKTSTAGCLRSALNLCSQAGSLLVLRQSSVCSPGWPERQDLPSLATMPPLRECWVYNVFTGLKSSQMTLFYIPATELQLPSILPVSPQPLFIPIPPSIHSSTST